MDDLREMFPGWEGFEEDDELDGFSIIDLEEEYTRWHEEEENAQSDLPLL